MAKQRSINKLQSPAKPIAKPTSKSVAKLPSLDDLVKDPDRIVELFGGEENYRKIFYVHDETREGQAAQAVGLPNVVPPPDCLTLERLEQCMADMDAKLTRAKEQRLELKQKLFAAYMKHQQSRLAEKKK